MDVAFIGEERIAMVAHTMEIDPEDIEAGDDERRKRHHCRVVVYIEEVGTRRHDSDGAEDKHHACCQCSGVAHEYLFLLVGIAEDVVVEEREKRALSSGGGYEREDIFPTLEEYYRVEDEGYRAQAGCKAVDAVDKIDGVDHVDHNKGREQA